MSSGNRSGFVLIEAVVALVIIGLFAIALIGTVGAQVRAADRGSVLLTARALAQDRLAAIQFLDYEELTDLPDSLARGAFPSPFEDFVWTAEVDAVDDEYDLFETIITVAGRGYSYPLRRMIHRPRPVIEIER